MEKYDDEVCPWCGGEAQWFEVEMPDGVPPQPGEPTDALICLGDCGTIRQLYYEDENAGLDSG